MLARAKLGATTRSEVAQTYRRLLSEAVPLSADPQSALSNGIYVQSVYGSSTVVPLDYAMQSPDWEETAGSQHSLSHRRETQPRAALHGGDTLAEPYHPVLPEMFDGPYGTYIRLGTIAVLAMFLILIVMGGLAMFAQLSQIIAH